MSGLWKWNKKERYKIICNITEKEFPLNNVHTEGMNRYQHPEFQVILKLPPALIHYLLKELMKKVQMGNSFNPEIWWRIYFPMSRFVWTLIRCTAKRFYES